MKNLKITIALSLISYFLIACSDSNEKKLIESLNEYKNCYASEDFLRMASFILPSVIEELGGTNDFVSLMESNLQSLKDQGYDFSNTKYGKPSPIIVSNKYLVSVVESEIPINTDSQTGKLFGSIIAFSEDNGNSWFFIDGNDDGLSRIVDKAPDVVQKISVPDSRLHYYVESDTLKMIQKNGRWSYE